MKEINFNFKLSQKEYMKAYVAWQFNRSITSPKQWIFFLFAIILAVNIFSRNNSSASTFIILLPIVFSLLILIYYFKLKKIFKSNKSYQDMIFYKFDEEHLYMETSSGKIEVKISSFDKLTQSKNWFFLYTNNLFVNFIPKKALSFEEIKTLKYILDKNSVKNTL